MWAAEWRTRREVENSGINCSRYCKEFAGTAATGKVAGIAASAEPRLPRCPQSREVLAGMVRGACKRRRGDHRKTLGVGDGCVGFELGGRHEAHDWMVLARRLQILAYGEKVDVGGAQIVHHLQNFVSFLAESDHEAGLGEHRGVEFLYLLQQADRGEVARAGPHGEILRRHGFEIVVEYVRLRCDYALVRAVLAQEIGGEHLDGRRWAARTDRANNGGKVRGDAVVEVVAIDRGHHDVLEAELRRRLGHPFRLGLVE